MDWCECWRTGEEEEGKSHLCAISQRSVFCAGGRAGGTITGIGTNLPARRATESGKAIRGRVGDAVAIHAGFGRDPALDAREPEEPGTDLDEGRRIHPSAHRRRAGFTAGVWSTLSAAAQPRESTRRRSIRESGVWRGLVKCLRNEGARSGPVRSYNHNQRLYG